MKGRPSARERLQAAADYVGNHKRSHSAEMIIAGLVAQHSATFRRSPTTNTLRVAGCQATCTWSDTDGLLDAWRGRATLKLMQLAGTSSAERERVS